MMWSPRALSFGMFGILASALLATASTAQQDAAKRQQMVDEIEAMLATDAVTGKARLSPRVRAAMTEVPRHEFVPLEQRSAAYRNAPLPIGHGQTISQPLVVALMTELLQLA